MHAYILYSYFNLITLKKSPHHTVRPTFSQVIAEEYSENDLWIFQTTHNQNDYEIEWNKNIDWLILEL